METGTAVILPDDVRLYVLELLMADANRIRNQRDHAASHGEYNFKHPSEHINKLALNSVYGPFLPAGKPAP